MRLTRFSDYSLRVLIYLGVRRETGVPVTVAELSDFYSVSRHHMRAVVHQLAVNGFIRSVKGKGGGLYLVKDPHDVNLGDVVRKTESDFYVVECFNPQGKECCIEPVCILKSVLTEAIDNFLVTLDNYTLADIINRKVQRLIKTA